MTNNDEQTAVSFTPQESTPELDEQALVAIAGGGFWSKMKGCFGCDTPKLASMASVGSRTSGHTGFSSPDSSAAGWLQSPQQMSPTHRTALLEQAGLGSSSGRHELAGSGQASPRSSAH